MLNWEEQKRAAAQAAAMVVRDGDVVGLGTGSTIAWLLPALARRAQNELHFVGIPTSVATERIAIELGLALGDFDEFTKLDVAIDGADEVDPNLNLIKGLGGALLREKLVASAARHLIIVVDESKLVRRLGDRVRVPIEVIPFGWSHTRAALERLGASAELRRGAEPFLTDGGHYILDTNFSDYSDLNRLASRIKAIPGVVEHGLFLDLAGTAIVGRADGTVETLTRPQRNARLMP